MDSARRLQTKRRACQIQGENASGTEHSKRSLLPAHRSNPIERQCYIDTLTLGGLCSDQRCCDSGDSIRFSDI
jgi:hypothetical protein